MIGLQTHAPAPQQPITCKANTNFQLVTYFSRASDRLYVFNSEFSLALDVIYFSLWLDEVVTLGFNLTRHLIENFLTGTIEKRFSTFLFIVLQRITFRYFFFKPWS